MITASITFVNTGTTAAPNNVDEKVIFKNCARFTSCIATINNTYIDDAHYIDVVMPMYNLKKQLEFHGNFIEMYRL